VAGIVETRVGATGACRPAVERGGLGAFHVGTVTAQPYETRLRALALADGDTPVSHLDELRLRLVHVGLRAACLCNRNEAGKPHTTENIKRETSGRVISDAFRAIDSDGADTTLRVRNSISSIGH
jgi:hypothetical protein